MNAEQALRAYDSYLASGSHDWRVGMTLLKGIQSFFGDKLDRSVYLKGIRRIAEVKPSVINREDYFFDKITIVPMEVIKSTVQETTKNGFFGIVEGHNVANLGGDASEVKRYKVAIMRTHEEFASRAAFTLGSRRGILKGKEASKIVTFGSCFAVNVGEQLQRQGFDVYTMLVAEDVNSTFNNLLMLKWLFLGERSNVADELAAIDGMDFALLREKLTAADEIILTLGNIFHLENAGVPTLQDGAVVVESIADTAECLDGIFSLLTTHTKASIIVSVSPVPISGYRGSEFASAVEADCASKSQLRAVLNETLRKYKGVVYMPTFEIFRWLAGHQVGPMYGVDDQNSRHISRAHVAMVMREIA